MRPALVYYGGKQSYINILLPLIPKHRVYIEPFAGGATVLFAKKRCSTEVVNDTLDCLINFYKILQRDVEREQLFQMVRETLYSRESHFQALELFKSGSDVEKAWATWYKINTGFSGKLDGGFSVTKDIGSSPTKKFQNYKQNLYRCAERLEHVQIEKMDALKCIDLYDSEKSFFFVDPPYLNADQGHYSGYTEKDFDYLLTSLSGLSGRFILTCYPGELVDYYIKLNQWNCLKIDRKIRARNQNHHNSKQPIKTEYIIMNYDPEIQGELF